MKEFRDDGYGVTVESLDFWKTHKNDIGTILSVESSFEPIVVLEDAKEWNTRITGSNGTILLSGCNSGYGGEGPNGTRKILEEVGVSPIIARGLMSMKHFTYTV
jgi:hypothetical protein